MSKIKVTLPGTEIPVNGKQVSFIAPCPCANATHLTIDNVDYEIVDALGNTPKDAWATGTIVSVILDVTNTKAYLLNGAGAAANPMNMGFYDKDTVFNEDGSITETSSTNGTLVTTFNDDGSITETYTLAGVTTYKRTVFNLDGSISERI